MPLRGREVRTTPAADTPRARPPDARRTRGEAVLPTLRFGSSSSLPVSRVVEVLDEAMPGAQQIDDVGGEVGSVDRGDVGAGVLELVHAGQRRGDALRLRDELERERRQGRRVLGDELAQRL